MWIQPPPLPHTRVRAGGYLPSLPHGMGTSAGVRCPAPHVACQWREGWSCRTVPCCRWLMPFFPLAACCGPHAVYSRRYSCVAPPPALCRLPLLHHAGRYVPSHAACVRCSPAACRAALLGDFYEDACSLRDALATTSHRLPPSPCRCTPEGTPALRLLLRYAACRSCTTLVGMSPPMLRACSAACRLRSLLAISMRCVLARDARAHLSRLPPALAGVLPKVLLHCVPSCAAPPAAPALRWSVCPLPCCVRAVLPAACASLLAISMRCVLARAALAYLSCPPPALVAPSAATLHSASPSSASSASSGSSTPLPDATSNASLPR